jgi:hypothetical protein
LYIIESFFNAFILQNDASHKAENFAKTGSGQTAGQLKKGLPPVAFGLSATWLATLHPTLQALNVALTLAQAQAQAQAQPQARLRPGPERVPCEKKPFVSIFPLFVPSLSW